MAFEAISRNPEHTALRSSPRKRKHRPAAKETYCSRYKDSDDEISSDDMEDDTYQRKPERQLMRPWLIGQVEKGDIPGLEWMDTEKTLIRIPWTHASRHGWDEGRDSCLFKQWAIHTGRYKHDDNGPESGPKKWKANFRCAMNSLPDVKEQAKMSHKKGHSAFKVYKLLPEKKRTYGHHGAKKVRTSSESDSEQHYKRYTTNADRLEKTKVMKELKKKLMSKHQVAEQDQRVPEDFSIPNPRGPDSQSPSGSDVEERKPIVTSIPKCIDMAESSWPSPPEDSVVRIEEVSTTHQSDLVQDHKEHSYARIFQDNNNSIPSFVEEDATSDYNSDVDEIFQNIFPKVKSEVPYVTSQTIIEYENNSPTYGYSPDDKYFPESYLYSNYQPDTTFKRTNSMDFSSNSCTMYNQMTYNNSIQQYSPLANINMNNPVSPSTNSLLQELENASSSQDVRVLNFMKW